MPKVRPKTTCYKVTLGASNMQKAIQSNGLFLYTVLTFLVVLAIYFGTKDWKGYTSPEEVDLGSVRVPAHVCRRKHRHRDY